MDELFMHIQGCPICTGVVMSSADPVNKFRPPSMVCEEGRSLAFKWLEYMARQGNGDAQRKLDWLREQGAYKG